MGTVNAFRLANKITEKVRNHELVFLGNTMREIGYSDNYANQPSRVTRRPTFIAHMKPLVEQLDSEINRIAIELAAKDLSQVQYESLTRAMDIQIKNKQLLSGGATERVINIEISEEIAKKNQ